MCFSSLKQDGIGSEARIFQIYQHFKRFYSKRRSFLDDIPPIFLLKRLEEIINTVIKIVNEATIKEVIVNFLAF